VLGRADQQAVGPEQVVDAGLERRQHAQLDIFACVGRTLSDRVEHGVCTPTGVTGMDQQ
jgi:hypothetical protein